jgi:hypothetical protein
MKFDILPLAILALLATGKEADATPVIKLTTPTTMTGSLTAREEAAVSKSIYQARQ